MKLRSAIIIFIVLLGVGTLAYFLPDSKVVPVAMVDYNSISQSELKEMSDSAYAYTSNLLKTYGGNDEELRSPENRREIRRATLEQLIEDRLIQKELENRIGNDLDLIVKTKIEPFVNDQNIKEAASTLYGISFKDYQRIFLVPQAKRDILEGRLFIENSDLRTWLEMARKEAKVIIFTTEFAWNENGVKLNNK